MKSSGLIHVVLSFAVCACSATATVVRKDQGSGQIALQGPYMSAMRDARTLIHEHCKGRFEVSELGENVIFQCRESLPQHEEILAGPRRVGDIDVDEAAVVQRDERDGRRKRAAGVKTLVDGIAALLEREQADVGVLDGQELQDALAQNVIMIGAGRPHAAPLLEKCRLRVHFFTLFQKMNVPYRVAVTMSSRPSLLRSAG